MRSSDRFGIELGQETGTKPYASQPRPILSLRLNNDLPIADYVALARAAERAGFDQMWVSHDLFLRSSPVILTAVALATERIRIGTGILNPYSIDPAELAMLAATLAEVSQGRFNLGIGAGAAEFLKWIGISRSRPLATTRLAIERIRATLAGQPAPGWEDEAYLRFSNPHHVPIYLAAMSPGMLRLAGEIADGVLPLLFPPEHYANVLPYITDGARAAGRSLDQIDIAACIWCSVSDDRSAAEDVLKDKIAYYGHALSPLIWEQLGLTVGDFRPIERALMTERDPARARALVTPAMQRIGIAGDAAALTPRLAGLLRLGVRHLSFGPPLGPDPVAAVSAISEIVGGLTMPNSV